MSSKRNLTVWRVLALLLSYVMLCVGGGVVSGVLFSPAVFGVNSMAKAVMPSLKVEGIDFDVSSLPQRSRMFAADGQTVIASFYAQNRTVVPLKDISQPMQQAVVAREDKRFFKHSGVDVQGVMRAFIQTFIKKGDTQGGSSLTQQYVKNVLMTKAHEDNDPIAEYHATEETIARKIREMLIAVQMEKQYSKPEILQGYLNIAQFGGNNIYGVEAAARRYFNVSAKDLNIGQAATIAAITKNPSKYDPSVPENLQESQNQRNIVLSLMQDQGYITKQQCDEAKATPLQDMLNIQDTTQVGCQSAGEAGFFCDFVTKQILNSKEFGKSELDRQKLLNEGGLDIYTTMDVQANNLAMQTARNTIPVDDPSGFEVSMAVIRPGTGEVLGFGNNRIYDATDAAKNDPTHTALNYAVDQKDGGGEGWHIGSSWKPINMVAWMQKGHSINESLRTSTYYPNSGFDCGHYDVTVGGWALHNADGGTTNPESPFLGLVHSHNTVQASMASQIGLCSIADAAKTLGYHNAQYGKEDIYSSDVPLHPSMVIGDVQVSPLTMANVFATIAANGVECTPIAVKKVVSKEGENLKVPSANCHQAIPSGIAQTTAYAMNQGVIRPDGVASVARLDGGRKTFAKTGTNENTYMSTGGFVPQVSTFVSVGNAESTVPFDGKTINGRTRGVWFGEDIAAPAWRDFMNAYLAQANIPQDNSYGTPDPQYTGGGFSGSQFQQRQQGH